MVQWNITYESALVRAFDVKTSTLVSPILRDLPCLAVGGLAKLTVELLLEGCAKLEGVPPPSAPYHLMKKPGSHSHLLQLSFDM